MMKKFSLVSNTIIVVIGLVIIGCFDRNLSEESRVDRLPYYGDASFTPQWLDGSVEELKEFHRIPAFNLIDQTGSRITENTFNNKIYVVDFFFTTCPGICPKMTANMSILHDDFIDDDQVKLLSHSVTPERDSVPVLREYADERGINANKWHLVTGDRTHIYTLGRQHYFIEEDLGLESNVDEFLHTENFVLIDQNRHIRGIYNGLNKTAIRQLITDINTLKTEVQPFALSASASY